MIIIGILGGLSYEWKNDTKQEKIKTERIKTTIKKCHFCISKWLGVSLMMLCL